MDAGVLPRQLSFKHTVQVWTAWSQWQFLSGVPADTAELAQGEAPAPLDDEKSVHQSVDLAKTRQQRQPNYKPRPDHPWKRIPVSPNQPPL